MSRTSIIISSENHTKKTDFSTQFSPGIHLHRDRQYEVSLIKADMYYSWTNISMSQGNNIFSYSTDSGGSWVDLTIDDGLYAIEEINELLPTQINIEGINATQKLKLTLSSGYQVRFINKLYKVFGFNENDVITSTTISPNKADLTNGIQSILIHCSLVDSASSIRNGTVSSVLYSVSPPLLPPGSLYNVVDMNGSYYLPMNTTEISDVRIWLTDQKGHAINNLGEDSVFHILIKQIE